MTRTFFVGSALPALEVGKELEWTFDDLMAFFALNLSLRQKKRIDQIRSYIDLLNVRQMVRHGALDPHGKLTEKELDEALVHREGLPRYLYTYLDRFEAPEEQDRHYAQVLIAFFQEMKRAARGFVHFYFSLERDLRLILAALRAKRRKLDVAKELQDEDFSDPLIAQLLAQKDATQFIFPFDYRSLGQALEGTEGDPLAEHRAVTQFRFNQIEEQFRDAPFAPDAAVGYFIQFTLIEDDNHLNDATGGEKLRQIATLSEETP